MKTRVLILSLLSGLCFGSGPTPELVSNHMSIMSAQGLFDGASEINLVMIRPSHKGPVVGFTLILDGQEKYFRIFDRRTDCGTVAYYAFSSKGESHLTGNFLYVYDHTKRRCGDFQPFKWVALLQDKDPFSVQQVKGEIVFAGDPLISN